MIKPILKKFCIIAALTLFITVHQGVNAADSVQISNGLKYKYYEGDWKDLILFMDSIQPMAEGVVLDLFDISSRQTNKAFGFEYSGYIDITTDGVYTFYAPEEWTKLRIDAGYELQLTVAGEKWSPITEEHANGTWSIALARGKHAIKVRYVDYRTYMPRVLIGEKYYFFEFDRTGAVQGTDRMNYPGLSTNFIWDGIKPQLEISGPNLEKQAIPSRLFYYTPESGSFDVSAISFYKNGIDITQTGLKQGVITSKANLSNNSSENVQSVVLSMSLYKKNNNYPTLEKLSVSEQVSISLNESTTLEATMEVPDISGGDYFIKLYFWDGYTKLTPLAAFVSFDEFGISY